MEKTSKSKILNGVQIGLYALQEEIKDNALWFSEDKYQELVQEKIDAIITK